MDLQAGPITEVGGKPRSQWAQVLSFRMALKLVILLLQVNEISYTTTEIPLM